MFAYQSTVGTLEDGTLVHKFENADIYLKDGKLRKGEPALITHTGTRYWSVNGSLMKE